MANTQVSLVGNVTDDPVLRFTQKGLPVLGFSIAVNEGTREEPRTSFYEVSAWRSLAQNCADTLKKGMRVLIIGALTQQTWETTEGKRSAVKITAEAIGPDLRFANAHVQKAPEHTARPEGQQYPAAPTNVPQTQGPPEQRAQSWEQAAVQASKPDYRDEPF